MTTNEITDIQVNGNEEGLTSEETTLLARIPVLAGSSKKATYLAYRSVGFTTNQAITFAKTTRSALNLWRKKDATFKKFEDSYLRELQSTVGNEVIKFDFIRNLKLLLNFDAQLIAKAMNNVNIGDKTTDGLTPREYELFKGLRKFYTPNDLLALEKILNPEKHKDSSTGPINIVLSWGSRMEPEPTVKSKVLEGSYSDIDPI